MQDKIDELVDYIQGNCLWQFFSRTWDREENICGVLGKTSDILTGVESVIANDIDRCHQADAKILSAEFKSKFSWIKELGADELRALLDSVAQRIREITITKSRNQELNIKYY
jgi:V-containing nitrogenase delta subunit